MNKRKHEHRSETGIHVAFSGLRAVLGRVVGRIVKPQDVDDILQETFIRAYVASQKTEIRHPRAFMLRTARNLALNQVTSVYYTRTQQTEDIASSSVYPTTETLESEFETEERFLGFCRAVRALPEQCRRVFILKKVYGLSQREIAQHLDIAQSTVEKHVAKGVLMCMQSMKQQGHDLDTADGKAASERKPRAANG